MGKYSCYLCLNVIVFYPVSKSVKSQCTLRGKFLATRLFDQTQKSIYFKFYSSMAPPVEFKYVSLSVTLYRSSKLHSTIALMLWPQDKDFRGFSNDFATTIVVT